MFNSGGTGARPGFDGLSATAFPSGVSTMSVEATEQVGPITVWRKDLRVGSGGAGAKRGGLGQTIEIEQKSRANDGILELAQIISGRSEPPKKKSGGLASRGP